MRFCELRMARGSPQNEFLPVAQASDPVRTSFCGQTLCHSAVPLRKGLRDRLKNRQEE